MEPSPPCQDVYWQEGRFGIGSGVETHTWHSLWEVSGPSDTSLQFIFIIAIFVFYKFKRGMQSLAICCFAPQMPTTARARPGWSREFHLGLLCCWDLSALCLVGHEQEAGREAEMELDPSMGCGRPVWQPHSWRHSTCLLFSVFQHVAVVLYVLHIFCCRSLLLFLVFEVSPCSIHLFQLLNLP